MSRAAKCFWNGIIFATVVYAVFTLAGAAFVQWDISYINPGKWDSSGRAVFYMCYFPVLFIGMVLGSAKYSYDQDCK